MIGTDREAHQLVERHAVLGVNVEKLGRHGGEPQPLLDHIDADEKSRGDLLLALSFLAQRQKRPELVERMQRRALDVLGETVLLWRSLCAHDAGNRRGASQTLLLHQQFQRPVTPPTRRDFEHAGLIAGVVQQRPHGDAL